MDLVSFRLEFVSVFRRVRPRVEGGMSNPIPGLLFVTLFYLGVYGKRIMMWFSSNNVKINSNITKSLTSFGADTKGTLLRRKEKRKQLSPKDPNRRNSNELPLKWDPVPASFK